MATLLVRLYRSNRRVNHRLDPGLTLPWEQQVSIEAMGVDSIPSKYTAILASRRPKRCFQNHPESMTRATAVYLPKASLGRLKSVLKLPKQRLRLPDKRVMVRHYACTSFSPLDHDGSQECLLQGFTYRLNLVPKTINARATEYAEEDSSRGSSNMLAVDTIRPSNSTTCRQTSAGERTLARRRELYAKFRHQVRVNGTEQRQPSRGLLAVARGKHLRSYHWDKGAGSGRRQRCE